jgi:hypothetical protein
LLVLVGACASPAGCAATHLSYVHNAVLGVDVTPVSNGGTARLAIGFDRETYALVPKCADEHTEAEAMSLFSASRVRVAGLDEISFAHAIATGEAAIDLAERPHDMGAIVERIHGRESKETEQ